MAWLNRPVISASSSVIASSWAATLHWRAKASRVAIRRSAGMRAIACARTVLA